MHFRIQLFLKCPQPKKLVTGCDETHFPHVAPTIGFDITLPYLYLFNFQVAGAMPGMGHIFS